MNKQGPPFYGKYRGVVTDNSDPWNIGRLRAKVEDVYGDRESGWALPSVPYAGKGVGLFLIPPVQSLVWIEFENGDPDYPIWSGCFWADEKVAAGVLPAKPAEPHIKVLKTEIAKIEIIDPPQAKGSAQAKGSGSITIEAKIGTQTLRLVMNSKGIEIDNGQGATVKLSSKTVSINKDGLEVT